MTLEQEFHGPNLGYVLTLYEQYQKAPDTVDAATRKFFEQWKPGLPSSVNLQALIGIINLAQAIRSHGYLAANLDPLGKPPVADPSLTLEFHKLQKEDLFGFPANIVNLSSAAAAADAYQAIETLRAIYSKTVGYDYGHIHNPEERDWLYQAAEAGSFRPPQQVFDGKKLLERLTRVEAFELFLQRTYPG